MKQILLYTLFLLIPVQFFAQAPNLGSAANFALFSSDGAILNTGISQVTGNIGTNVGSSTGFGNVNGVMHDEDGASALCAADLLLAYGEMNVAIPTSTPAPAIGNGMTMYPGVHAITGDATLDLNLILDAQGDPNAVFIFQISATLSTSAGSSIELINDAMACNVFWKVEGLVSIATGTDMKGTIVANNAAIEIATGSMLEGRALSTTGAVSVDGVKAKTPIGCGSPVLNGPTAPNLGVVGCYGVFSTDGAVTNNGITNVTGDVGSNNGAVTGFDPLLVDGEIHLVSDQSTAQAANDLLVAYNYLNVLPYDIELLYPAQLGNNLVLTPQTYLLNAAAIFTDSLYLDAQGVADAVFVIKINGALTTSTYSKVLLINGALAENVYWKIEGAVTINNYSVFNGTIVCNNGALGAINTGVEFNGRALTTNGELSTTALDLVVTDVATNCGVVGLSTLELAESLEIYPNPFSESITIKMDEATSFTNNYELKIVNTLGKEVLSTTLTQPSTVIKTDQIPAGIYFFTVYNNDKVIRNGKLIAQ